jgi:hypothetical protein
LVLVGLLGSVLGCAPSLEQRRVAATPATDALSDGDFDSARDAAVTTIEADEGNPYANLVSAITRYRRTMHQLFVDLSTVVAGAAMLNTFNHRYVRRALADARSELGMVDRELARAAAEPRIALELCPACWTVDWNRNGRLDETDAWLLEIELDERGDRYPPGDPRRRPTFRFDHGDVLWARAFIAFHLAALELVLAYEWTSLDDLIREREPEVIVFELREPERVAAARRHILDGLALAEQARRSYLAETDDDREWLPNPRQRDHPLPLPVDEQLYETWGRVLDDLQRLVRGEEGLSVSEAAQLGDHRWRDPPGGYIDIGRMLAEPRDIRIDLRQLERIDDLDERAGARQIERLLSDFLGPYYVARMKPSPLLRRLSRMKREIERGEDTFERKLRYLLWLN